MHRPPWLVLVPPSPPPALPPGKRSRLLHHPCPAPKASAGALSVLSSTTAPAITATATADVTTTAPTHCLQSQCRFFHHICTTTVPRASPAATALTAHATASRAATRTLHPPHRTTRPNLPQDFVHFPCSCSHRCLTPATTAATATPPSTTAIPGAELIRTLHIPPTTRLDLRQVSNHVT